MTVYPLVSIALATYNGERYIKEFLISINEQDYPAIEIIISDDSSLDKTCEIIDSFICKYPIKLIKNQKNIGHLRNFEKSLSMCNGTYIALADQDDIWYPNKISLMINEIGSYSMIYSDAKLIDEYGDDISDSYSKYSAKITYISSFAQLCMNGIVTGCTSLFKADILKTALPFPSGKYVHDRWLSACAYLLNGILYTDSVLLSYRQHVDNSVGARKHWITGFARILRVDEKYCYGVINHYEFMTLIRDKLSFIICRHDLEQLSICYSFYSFLIGEASFLSAIKSLRYFEYGKPFFVRLIRFINILKVRYLYIIRYKCN
jgi:glycosyltransferase involved in cell wall biosynthesis